MNIETKHSPLPWEAEAPSLVVLDAYGNVVADCEVETFECERMANAELIALACNNHDKLVGALRRLADVAAVLCNLRAYPSAIRQDVWGEVEAATAVAKMALEEAQRSALAAPSLA
jgi:hypothetical protein